MCTTLKKIIKPYHLLLAPATIYVLLTTLYPVAQTLSLSLTNLRWDRLDKAFIGFQNFRYIFNWPPFWQIVKNSFVFVIATVCLKLVLGLSIALVLNSKRKGTSFIRVVSILPWIMPQVVVAVFFRLIFNASKLGLINQVLSFFSLPIQTWLSEPGPAMIILILGAVWHGVGFSIILTLAALQTVPDELYEAAILDGASKRQLLWRITIPLIIPTLAFTIINISAQGFNMISIVFGLTGGGPGYSTETLALSVYKTGFDYYEAGQASSMAVMLLFINLIMTLIYIRIMIRKEDPIHD